MRGPLGVIAKRRLWLLLGWSSLLGNLGDGMLALYAGAVVVASPAADIGLTVEVFLQEHVAWLHWVKAVASSVLPPALVVWLFELPALVYFPVRVLLGTAVGWWAFVQAGRLAPPAGRSPWRRHPEALPVPPGRAGPYWRPCLHGRPGHNAGPQHRHNACAPSDD